MTISPLAGAFVQLLIAVLVVARATDVSISSFLRTPERNEAVGGRPNSLHLVGLAVDLVGEPATLGRVASIWRAIGLDAIDEGDHLHLELDGPLLRN